MKALKILATFAFITLFFSLPPSFAESLKADSKILEVTVFPDRALVTRQAQLDLPAGSHEIKLEGLSGLIFEDSVSAKGEGNAKVKLFGARLITSQLTDAQPPRLQELEKQIRELRAQQQSIDSRKKIAKAKEEFLNSIKAASGEQIGKDLVTKQPSVSDAENLLKMLDTQLTSIYESSRNADEEIQALGREIDRLQRELNQLQEEYRRNAQQNTIAVDVEAESSGKFTLQVAYQVPEASWEPVYEARANTQGAQLQFDASAIVRQRTGEDWKDVQLVISTAQPAINGRMPEIQPWYLYPYQPQPMMLARAKLTGGMLQEMSKDRAAVSAPGVGAMEAEKPVAIVEASGTAVQYRLPRLETILSDWQPKKVAVSTFALPVQLAHEITPRLSPYAYLRAKVKNTTENLFLPGKVQIFLDGAFVGSSWIKLTGLNETFDVYLGVNEKIKVEQKQLKAKEDISVLPGLHGRIKTVQYEYLTKIENFQKTPADLVVFDQVPVSQNDEIKIEDVKFDPQPAQAVSDKPGVSQWNFTLAPGQKQTIRISYRVKYPADFQVNV